MDSNNKAYILSGFIKVMERIHWKKTDPLYYTLLVRTLDLLCHMTQEKYVYHIDGGTIFLTKIFVFIIFFYGCNFCSFIFDLHFHTVLSNDELYGSEEEFIDVLENHATNICQELLVVLKALGDVKETKKQYNLALELFWRIIKRSDLKESSMATLAVNLWGLSQKNQDSSNNFAVSKACFYSPEKI